jgi:chromate reductase, NAD(P)H dehydrogenase (quinone)
MSLTSHVPANVLVFAGSARAGSYNKKLARIAADALREAGAAATFIDLRDYPLPMYDGDFEDREGIPLAGRQLRQLFRAADALVIASPEYNHSFSPLLKNAIDWVSRRADGEDYRPYFQGKIAALLAASSGSSGGVRGLPHLRQVLAHLGVAVLERQVTIPRHKESFGSAEELREEAHRLAVKEMADAVILAVRQRQLATGERAA